IANYIRIRRRRRAFPRLIRTAATPEIDDVYLRQATAADAVGKVQQRVLSAFGIRPALERRRCTAEYNDGSLESRSNNCELARVIARGLALLVARLVLFIHDYRAEILER